MLKYPVKSTHNFQNVETTTQNPLEQFYVAKDTHSTKLSSCYVPPACETEADAVNGCRLPRDLSDRKWHALRSVTVRKAHQCYLLTHVNIACLFRQKHISWRLLKCRQLKTQSDQEMTRDVMCMRSSRVQPLVVCKSKRSSHLSLSAA